MEAAAVRPGERRGGGAGYPRQPPGWDERRHARRNPLPRLVLPVRIKPYLRRESEGTYLLHERWYLATED